MTWPLLHEIIAYFGSKKHFDLSVQRFRIFYSIAHRELNLKNESKK